MGGRGAPGACPPFPWTIDQSDAISPVRAVQSEPADPNVGIRSTYPPIEALTWMSAHCPGPGCQGAVPHSRGVTAARPCRQDRTADRHASVATDIALADTLSFWFEYREIRRRDTRCPHRRRRLPADCGLRDAAVAERFDMWPNSSLLVRQLEYSVHAMPWIRMVGEMPEPGQYAMRDQLKQWQVTATYEGSFTYKGQTVLSGRACATTPCSWSSWMDRRRSVAHSTRPPRGSN